MGTLTIKHGLKGYHDTLRGCVPCKVIAWKRDTNAPYTVVQVEYTKTVNGFTKGERQLIPLYHFVSKCELVQSGYTFFIHYKKRELDHGSEDNNLRLFYLNCG